MHIFMLIFMHALCAFADVRNDNVVNMQALPALQQEFEHHWIFQEHPLFLPNVSPLARREWESWCTLQLEVYHSAVRHMFAQADCGRTMSDLIVWRPCADLLRRAREMGATWAPVHACMQLLSDPCAQAVMTKVCMCQNCFLLYRVMFRCLE